MKGYWKILATGALSMVSFVGGYILGITGGVLDTFFPTLSTYFLLGLVAVIFLLWLEPWKWLWSWKDKDGTPSG